MCERGLTHGPLGFQIGLDVCLRIPFNLAANNLVPLWKVMSVVISGCLPCPPQRATNPFYLQTSLIVSLSPLGRYSKNPNLRLYANKQRRPMQSQLKTEQCQRSAETCETHLVENKILDGKAWRLYWLSALRNWLWWLVWGISHHIIYSNIYYTIYRMFECTYWASQSAF